MGLFKNKNKKSLFDVVENKKILHKNLDFTATEQYKLLRTNLDFTLPENEQCPIIGVTSSMRGDGKSITAVNLSYVIAEKGKKVLLIDGDLRIPTISKKMNIESTIGLTDLLMGKGAQMSEFQSAVLKNWYILPSGDIPPNPSELLGSRRMEAILSDLKEKFDYIIIDLPPVNLVSDALSVSKFITGLILVIREDYTEKKEFERCIRQISLSSIKVLGCVINAAKSGGSSYRKYRKYKYYKYYKNSQYTQEDAKVESK